MKVFKIGCGGSITEMFLSQAEEESLSLGEMGRGRKLVFIPVIGSGPEAKIKMADKSPVIVMGDFPPEDRCIAVIGTGGGYSKGYYYSIPDVDGLKKVATGHYASGMAGRASGSENGLCIIEKGTEFTLSRKYDDNMWFSWDGAEWTVETVPERKSRLAKEIVEQGGGEWL